MPQLTPATFNLETLTPSELESRRRDIIRELQSDFRGYDDPTVPLPLLQELAAVTSTLRRRNAGPSKTPKLKRTSTKPPPVSIDDLIL